MPILGAILSLLARLRQPGPAYVQAHALIALIAPAVCLLLLLSYLPRIQSGEALVYTLSWIPGIGLDLAFRLDGLSWLFAVLITGIGCLIIIYARYYFAGKDTAGRFFVLIQLFMTAMLGIVLSENLLFMLVFWELTSDDRYPLTLSLILLGAFTKSAQAPFHL